VKCKIGQSEEKGEFGSSWSGFQGLKGGTPIMLEPSCLWGLEVDLIILQSMRKGVLIFGPMRERFLILGHLF
jgi:hypothetical protein